MARDYELLCHLYGISGARRHCCLWCEIKSEDLKIPRKNRDTSLRTLDKLTARHTAFLEAGGNIKNAKHFCNRLLNLLEDECHELDQKTATTASIHLSSYEKYMEAKTCLTTLKEKDLLTEQIKIALQYLVLQLLTTPVPMHKTTVQSTSKRIAGTVRLLCKKIISNKVTFTGQVDAPNRDSN
uniref:Uncharacterized protein n=1 Tax=Amphimedon queenslandica TaxID=400682 RepID=A0A1X7VX80_AMPQE